MLVNGLLNLLRSTRCVMALPPILLSPYGLFLYPLTPCHTAPPIACRKLLELVSFYRARVSGLPTYSHAECSAEIR
jgi:hypothetical protein